MLDKDAKIREQEQQICYLNNHADELCQEMDAQQEVIVKIEKEVVTLKGLLAQVATQAQCIRRRSEEMLVGKT